MSFHTRLFTFHAIQILWFQQLTEYQCMYLPNSPYDLKLIALEIIRFKTITQIDSTVQGQQLSLPSKKEMTGGAPEVRSDKSLT